MEKEIQKKKEITETQRKRIQSLLHQHKRWIGIRDAIRPHKEPILLLIRRNGHIEVYQDQTKDYFVFRHSNGKTARITLGAKHKKELDYAGETIGTYICHEDSAVPIGSTDPELDMELVEIGLDKVLHDNTLLDAQAKLETAKGASRYKLIVGLAIFAGVVLMGFMVAGDEIVALFRSPATQTVVTVVQNISTIPGL